MQPAAVTTPAVWPFPQKLIPAMPPAPPRWALPAERIREERTAVLNAMARDQRALAISHALELRLQAEALINLLQEAE